MAIRLHEASKQYNINYKELVAMLEELGFQGKTNPLSSIPDDLVEALEALIKKSSTKGAAPIPGKGAAKAQKGKTPESKSPVPAPPATAKPDRLPAQSPVSPGQTAPQPKQVAPSALTPRVPTQPAAPSTSTQQTATIPGGPPASKEERKKGGPKPPRETDEEEIEVNKQITIIKTVLPKKEPAPARPKKKKVIKKDGRQIPLKKERRIDDEDDVRLPDPLSRQTSETPAEEEAPALVIPESVTPNQLARYLDVEGVEIVKKLLAMGVFASLNQRLERDSIQILVRDYGKEAVFTDDVIEFEEEEVCEEDLKPRPPVVTIMGHVDHGKTSLLDFIRKTHVADAEVGGITQHIGAYQVKTSAGTITLIDTPGHEAFTAMRAQGAMVTDIAVLVVAADDGVQPQTVEAIHHAQAADVPIIVAINKMDKPESNADRVKQQLMPYNLVSEDWGGKTIVVPVSAKTGTGIPDLLEMILLQAELLELKASPGCCGRGTIIEAKLDRGMGPIATVLIQNGTIAIGDNIICGTCFGRVKALINHTGQRIQQAGPAFPVAILGLSEVPKVGDQLRVVENAKFARFVGELRQRQAREERLARDNRIRLIDVFKHVSDGKTKDLNIIIKADVQGSAGALKDALERMSTAEVKVQVLHAGVGAITESDVMLATASNAIIVGFHARPATGVDDIAKREGVEIRVFRIIYDAIDAVRLALKGMYDPVYEEEILGRLEIRRVFKIPGVGAIAGSYVLDGKVQRNASVRVIRDGVEIFEGRLNSLKRFKDDVREVLAGYECGVGITNYNDIKEKDLLEFFQMKEVERA